MSPADVNRPGMIDLSTLGGSPAGGEPGVSYVQEGREADFSQVASRSLQYPVVLELTLSSAPETRAVDQALIELANAAGGRWLLARVDVAQAPAIAQGLGVQAVPTVLVLLGGRAMPLFQGTRDKADIAKILDQVTQMALANGITGRAQPVPNGLTAAPGAVPGPRGAEAGQPVVDPRFAAADEALSKGDYVAAQAEFDKLVAANPRDAEAVAGRAQVALLIRAEKASPEATMAAAQATPDDVEANLAAADVEMLLGDREGAFARLLRLVRTTTGDDRDRARARLLELFSTVEPGDPAVASARRELMAALF